MMWTLTYLLLAITSSLLLVRRLLQHCGFAIRGVAGLTCFAVLVILPVHAIAALQLVGLAPLNRAALLATEGGTFLASVGLYRYRRVVSDRDPANWSWISGVPLHLRVAALTLAGGAAVYIARMTLGFPDGWDAVTYHIPLSLRWLQEGSLRIDGSTDWHFSLPGNVESIALILLAGGAQRLLGFVQWPGLVALLFAVWCLSARLVRSPEASLAVVITVLSIPMVFAQSFNAYVDLFGAGFLVSSVALGLAAVDSMRNRTAHDATVLALFSGLAFGLAIGTKPVFWVYGAMLAVCSLAWLLWPGPRNRVGLTKAVCWAVVGALLPSVFWFGRAFAETGNPFYPMGLRWGSIVLQGVTASAITPGTREFEFVRRPAEWLVYAWTEWKSHVGEWLVNYGVDSGLGAMFAAFAIPGLFYFAWISLAQRTPEPHISSRNVRLCLAFAAASMVLWLSVLRRELRFALPVIILICLVAAPLLAAFERSKDRLYRSLFVASISITVGVLVCAPCFDIASILWNGRSTRARYYGYPELIDNLPPETRLLNCAGETFNFALSGANLSNRVIACFEALPRAPEEFLRSRRIDLLVDRLVLPLGPAEEPSPPFAQHLRLAARADMRFGDRQRVVWRIWNVASDRPERLVGVQAIKSIAQSSHSRSTSTATAR